MTLRFYIALAVLLTATGLVSAQNTIDLRPTISSQLEVRFDVPDDWDTLFFENDGVIISETDNVFMAVYFTPAVRRLRYTTVIPAELNQLYAQERAFEETTEDIIEVGDAFRTALRHSDGILFSETYGEDDIILIDVRTNRVDDVLEETLLAMLDTLEPYNDPIAIENYRSGWRIITTELATKGYIREGSIIQTAPVFEFAGAESDYQPLAENDIVQDILVGATISLSSGAEDVYETCGVMSRVIEDETETVVNFLEVGVDSDNDAYIFDRYGSLESDATLNYGTVSNPEDEVYIVYKVDGGLANVFANGELVLSNLLIQEREGHFGLSFVGRDDESSCVINDVWFYELGSDCTITATDTVDTFFSPEETDVPLGELEDRTEAVVDAFYLDAELTQWWRIASDSRWVSSEDIRVSGACGNVAFAILLADVN